MFPDLLRLEEQEKKKKKKENQHKVPVSTTIHCIIDQGAGLPGNNAG